MGGEGSMMAAMASLKANRALKNKRRKQKFSLVSSTNENWVDPKQPTQEQLLQIRTRIRKEEKARRTKTVILTLIMIVIFCLGILYISSY
ncbi:hypothetical protein [uncultured Dokdonia sp.]|uniref:hypothetical protein n=1 Tax=uncultured Dokdonia sp. TaxID=575653 RepID=UPI002627561A|nr:hypothetical protein [uncultured Dokdonia sp.]